MKKITLSIITFLSVTSYIHADGSMEAMDKYNLAYPTLNTEYNGGNSTVEEPGLFDSLFGDYAEDEPSGFYIGLGYGKLKTHDDTSDEEISGNTILMQMGYTYNQFLGFEGRFYWGIGDPDYDEGNTNPGSGVYTGDLSAWGVYAKPSLPLGHLKIYGLIGYGSVNIDDSINDSTVNSFQWGGGLDFSINESLHIFADYTKLYDGTSFDNRAIGHDVSTDVISVGISYKF